MKLRRPRFAVVGVAVATSVLLTASACSASKGSSSQGGSSGSAKGDFVVDTVQGLSGTFATNGHDELIGLQAEAQLLNEKGGILGHHVTIVSRDDGSDVQRGISATQQLLQSNHPNLFVPDAINAASQIPFSKNILTTTSCASTVCGDGSKYPLMFDNNISTAEQVQALLAYSQKQGYKRVGILATDTVAAHDFADLVKSEEGKYGVQVVSQEFFTQTATDVTSQLQKLRAAGSQAVYGWTEGSSLAPAATGLQDLGWKVPYVGPPALFVSNVNQYVPAPVVPQITCVCFAVSSRPGSTVPAATAPLATTAAKFGSVTTFAAMALSADSLALAAYGYTKAGSLDPKKAAQAIENIGQDKNYPGQDFWIWRTTDPDFKGTNHDPGASVNNGFFAIEHPSPRVYGTYQGTPFNF